MEIPIELGCHLRFWDKLVRFFCFCFFEEQFIYNQTINFTKQGRRLFSENFIFSDKPWRYLFSLTHLCGLYLEGSVIHGANNGDFHTEDYLMRY